MGTYPEARNFNPETDHLKYVGVRTFDEVGPTPAGNTYGNGEIRISIIITI
jgi:hypothetical protein